MNLKIFILFKCKDCKWMLVRSEGNLVGGLYQKKEIQNNHFLINILHAAGYNCINQ